MRTENRFDPVFDCQQVFKALMNALAQPGKVFSIQENVKRLGGDDAPFRAVALTLLDNWRSFYVEDAPALAENLRELTYGVPAPLEEADYLFFPRMGEPGPVMEKAKPGTLPEPHKSATIFLLADSLTGGEAFSLTGPGIEGTVTVTLPAPCRAWLEARQAQLLARLEELMAGLPALPEEESLRLPLLFRLLAGARYDPEGGPTAWDALVGDGADSEGLALTFQMLAEELEVGSALVEGTLDGQSH